MTKDQTASLPPIPFYEGYIAAAQKLSVWTNPYTGPRESSKRVDFHNGYRQYEADLTLGLIAKPELAKAI